MQLGNFSVSLSVKNLQASKTFYLTMGFELFHGDEEMGYVILKNGDCIIGLFQGMFEKNLLTFNPGWDANGQALERFTDIRELQKQLQNKGLSLDSVADSGSSGPASFMITDPDGNQILFDQHI